MNVGDAPLDKSPAVINLIGEGSREQIRNRQVVTSSDGRMKERVWGNVLIGRGVNRQERLSFVRNRLSPFPRSNGTDVGKNPPGGEEAERCVVM